MIKTVQFEGHSLEINTSGGWFFVYKDYFGHDILPDILPALESMLQMAVSIAGKVSPGETDVKDILKALDEDTLEEVFMRMAGAEITTVMQIVWAMAKNADTGVESPREFFNRYDAMPWDEVGQEVFKALLESNVSSKNVKSLLASLKTKTKNR